MAFQPDVSVQPGAFVLVSKHCIERSTMRYMQSYENINCVHQRWDSCAAAVLRLLACEAIQRSPGCGFDAFPQAPVAFWPPEVSVQKQRRANRKFECRVSKREKKQRNCQTRSRLCKAAGVVCTQYRCSEPQHCSHSSRFMYSM